MIMKRLNLILLIPFLFFKIVLFAASPPDEGMWLPLLLKDYNYEEMQRLGLKLTAEQIYSVNNSSLKDAIVQMGGFCTGEIISEEGLFLTNHHCGYDAIAAVSTETKNYLDDGFWAMNRDQEIPIQGLTVRFLKEMSDVSDEVIGARDSQSSEYAEMAALEKISEIETRLSQDGQYIVEVKKMFEGNAYYAFVYEEYTDIRLVGAPPSSIGKFGGDTDNWMWPRHTGDFSMFRIYAGPKNQPNPYSTLNKPFKPKHSLPVSTEGMKEGDFTMVMGFPGSTSRYMTSYEMRNLQNSEAPIMASVLKDRLAIMKKAMDQSDKVRIENASTYASLANTAKYYEGQLLGLKKFDQLSKQKLFEEQLQKWIASSEDNKKQYGSIFADLEVLFKKYEGLSNDSYYVNLAGFAPDFVTNGFGIDVYRLNRSLERETDIDQMVETLTQKSAEYFDGYQKEMDREMTLLALKYLHKLSDKSQIDLFTSDLYLKKCKGSDERYVDLIMKKSMLTNKKLLDKFLKKPSAKAVEKDPGMAYVYSIINCFRSSIMANQAAFDSELSAIRKKYLKAIEFKSEREFYPDANFTLRVTYGTVQPYDSWDGKPYNTFTYASEILDKYKAGDSEFDVPEKLRNLIQNKDFGAYANENGKLNVCFLHNTDITGGNSGSPVINAKGELIGCAFDGNWESMTSDIFWQDDYVRTISVDIRYVLFIIDKFAGAGHLIEEMNLVSE